MTGILDNLNIDFNLDMYVDILDNGSLINKINSSRWFIESSLIFMNSSLYILWVSQYMFCRYISF